MSSDCDARREQALMDVLGSCTPVAFLEMLARLLYRVLCLPEKVLRRPVALGFMYIMFQVLALIWAFLCNAVTSVALDLAGFLLAGPPLREVDKAMAFAAFYFFYATFRSIFRFNTVVASVAWRSLDDVQARRVVDIISSRGRFALPLLLLPQALAALVTLTTPHVCHAAQALTSDEFDLVNFVCRYSPLVAFSGEDVLTRRVVQHTLVIGLVQVALIFMALYPDWHRRVLGAGEGRPTTFRVVSALFLNSTLAVILAVTFLYWIRWLGLHLGVDVVILDLGGLLKREVLQDAGLALTMVWCIWLLLFACALPEKECSKPGPEALSTLFYNLKALLIIVSLGYFWRGCAHPQIGFVAAQQEFVGLVLILPICYATGYVFALFLNRLTLPNIYLVTTIAGGATVVLMRMGHVVWWKAPGLALFVFLHLVTKLTQYFGSQRKPHIQLDEKKDAAAASATHIRSGDINKFRKRKLSQPTPVSQSLAGEADQETTQSIEALAATRSSFAGLEGARRTGLGFARVAWGFVFVFASFVLLFASFAILQEEFRFFPETISFRIRDTPEMGETIVIDHAKLTTLELSKRAMNADPKTCDRDPSRPKYATCGVNFFDVPLNVVDYALLAEVAYFNNDKNEIDELLGHLFVSNDTKDFEVHIPEDCSYDKRTPQFFDVHFPTLNVSVVAVRGTDIGRMADYIEDIKLYTEPVAIQLIGMVFPSVRFMSDDTVAKLIEWYSGALAYFGLRSEPTYHEHLLNYVEERRKGKVVLTGHSLGGGLARLVGAISGYPSITFSPPGIGTAHRKYKALFKRSALHDKTVAIVPEHDLVPRVDTQVGLQQGITCESSGQAIYASCHMIEGTICELIKSCGDDRFRSCKFEYSFVHLAEWVWSQLQKQNPDTCTWSMVMAATFGGGLCILAYLM